MTPDQAQFLLSSFLSAIEMEWKTTKTVLQAIPSDNRDYRPDPKARSATELAWHIVSSEIWFLEGIIKAEFSMEEKAQSEERIDDMIGRYEKVAPDLIEKLRALPLEVLSKPVSFFGLFHHPLVVYLGFMLYHTIHHRGQLTAYLRPMGGKVPPVYGGSADEPFQMPE